MPFEDSAYSSLEDAVDDLPMHRATQDDNGEWRVEEPSVENLLAELAHKDKALAAIQLAIHTTAADQLKQKIAAILLGNE